MMKVTDAALHAVSNQICFLENSALPAADFPFCVLPPLPLKEQAALFRALLPEAEARGITLLVRTCGEAADTGALKRVFAGMKGAGVCWDAAATLRAAEPLKTTVKSLFWVIRAAILPPSEIGLRAKELLLSEGYRGLFCFSEE